MDRRTLLLYSVCLSVVSGQNEEPSQTLPPILPPGAISPPPLPPPDGDPLLPEKFFSKSLLPMCQHESLFEYTLDPREIFNLCTVVADTLETPLTCTWTGILTNPSSEHLLSLTIDALEGIDQGVNFVTIGRGSNPANESSIITTQTGTEDRFNLKTLFEPRAIWFNVTTVNTNPRISLNMTLVDNASCDGSDFKCDDGSCVTQDGKLNGYPDCPDGSDESSNLGYRDCAAMSRVREGFIYTGKQRNEACVPWEEVHEFSGRGLLGPVCYSIGGDWPRCYIDQTNWTKCDIPSCEARAGCYHGNGVDYRDLAQYSTNGYRCVNWAEIHSDVFNVLAYPNADLSHNFCRNPDGSDKPWCFYRDVEDNLRRADCIVEQCTSEILQQFRRIPRVEFNIDAYNHDNLQNRNLPNFSEEDCAQSCAEETNFKCRSFVFKYERQSTTLDTTCSWSSVSPTTTNVVYQENDRTDVFVRTDSECDALLVKHLPANCPFPLGMKQDIYASPDGLLIGVWDDNISASSYLSEEFHYRFVRYDSPSCWASDAGDLKPWLQVDLGALHVITGIVLQACNGGTLGWMEEFSIQSRTANNTFVTHRDRTTRTTVLRGSSDARCSKIVSFDPWIYAESVRINPVTGNTNVGLRFEFLGCRHGCDRSLGITDLQIYDATLTASSVLDSDHSPPNARIQPLELQLLPTNGWSPNLAQEGSKPAWIQVDFGELQVVRAIVTQGCPSMDSYLQSFTLDYSTHDDTDDDEDIDRYRRSDDGDDGLVFQANSDSHTIVRNTLPFQIKARFIRLNAVDWGGSGQPCLKFDVIGCHYDICGNSLHIGRGITGEHITEPSGYACVPESWVVNGNSFASEQGRIGVGESTARANVAVTFPEKYVITAVLTQGSINHLTEGSETWATKFTLQYAADETDDRSLYRPYLSRDGTQKVFDANYDGVTPVTNVLDRPVAARTLQITYYNDEKVSSIAPCIRFDLEGCKLSDAGHPCGQSSIIQSGFCMGTVESNSPDACTSIYQEQSRLAVVSSPELQRVLNDFPKLLLPGFTDYRIGLMHHPDQYYLPAPFMWIDGTPVLTHQFETGTRFDHSMELCVTIDVSDGHKWKASPCDSATLSPASLCQFDIDECLQVTDECSHECNNYPGGYICSCPEGMYIEEELPQESCKSLCIVLGLASSASLNGSCFEFNHRNRTFEAARQECMQDGQRLITADELQLMSHELDEQHSHATVWVEVADRNESHCFSADLDLPLISVRPISCDDRLAFICIKDDLPRMLEINTTAGQSRYDVTDASLYITWAGLPPWYGDSTSVFLNIKVESHLILRFYFIFMNLRAESLGVGYYTASQSTRQGCLDFLVLNENDASGKVIRKRTYCGDVYGFNVESKTNDVSLLLSIKKLESNLPQYLTVQLMYEARDCETQQCNFHCASSDQAYTAPEGRLSTFNYPEILPPYYSCSWTIQLPPGSYIHLQFVEVSIDCPPGEGINIFARHQSGSYNLDEKNSASLCSQRNVLIISETNRLIVSYDTGLNHQSRGFVATYQSSDMPGCRLEPRMDEDLGQCELTFCNASRALIASPNYPINYDKPAVCFWEIATAPGTFITLRFEEFNVPYSSECAWEYLQISDSEKSERYCNGYVPTAAQLSYTSSRNNLRIQLSSLYGIFRALYEEQNFIPSTAFQLPTDSIYYCRGGGWQLYDKQCFIIERANSSIKWTEAAELCHSKQSYIASIRNIGEANFIHNLTLSVASEATVFHIGLYKSERDAKVFQWDDGSPLSYTDWYNRDYNYTHIQPDGGTPESCTVIDLKNFDRTDNWFDIPCAAKITTHYICSHPAALSEDPTDPAKKVTLHHESCPGGYHNIAGMCLVLVRSANDSDICPGHSSLISETFVVSNLKSVQFYLEKVWRVAASEAKVILSTPDGPMMVCIQHNAFALDTDACYSNEPFKFCGIPVTLMDESCSSGQFQCLSGECINSVFVCDAVESCSDGSDEYNCTNCEGCSTQELPPASGLSEVCESSQFACLSGGCIHSSFICDSKGDCQDGSDELGCTFPDCGAEEFPCRNLQCIPVGDYCNLVIDCYDGSDEEDCRKNEHNFQCYSGLLLPGVAYCDGYRHCDGQSFEDEPQSCDYLQPHFGCDPDVEIQCKNRVCASIDHLCVLDHDIFGLVKGCRDLTHLRYCEEFECSSLQYKCPDSYCIPQYYRCDGRPHCPGGEDEQNCDEYICSGGYRCQGSPKGVCVAQHFVCDGIPQCPWGDDEYFCGFECPPGCSCSGLVYSCRGVDWTTYEVAKIPSNIKQLSLSNLQITERRKRESVVEGDEVTMYDTTLIILQNFPLLYALDLSNNGISSLGNGTFSASSNLQKLNLSFNEICCLGTFTFAGATNLRELDLRGNPLGQVAGSPFLTLNVLEFISIEESEVTISDEEFVSGLEKIEIFHSDRFYYCCLLDHSPTLDECLPNPDEFSSCTDLIRSTVQKILIWIMAICALTGNIIVITLRILKKRKSSSQSKNNSAQPMLIMNLAIADLLMGCYLLMIAVADVSYRGRYGLFSDVWQKGFFCRFSGFLSTISSVTSVLFLTAISMDRFFSVLYPLSTRRLREKSALVLCTVIWIVMILLGVLPALFFGGNYYGRSSVCLALPITSDRPSGWLYSFFLFIILNLVLFLIIVVCYAGIFVIASRSTKFSKNLTKSEETLKKEQLQIALKVSFLVATDFFCWMPIIMMGFLSLTQRAIGGDIYAWTAILILPINSAVNPYVYTFMIQRSNATSGSNSSSSKDTHQMKMIDPPDSSTTRLKKESTVPADENSIVKIALSCMRLNRLLLPAPSDRYQKYLLSSMIRDSQFTLSNVEKDDIVMDVMKALKYLHDNGVTHGHVCADYVVIDQMHAGNKRAYLLMHGKTVKEASDTGTEQTTGYQEDNKQFKIFSSHLEEVAET